MITVLDVAKEAGVTRQTVYNVLNFPEKVSKKSIKKVEDAIKKLNYRPSFVARSLVTGKTDTIGLVLPETVNPTYSEMLEFIEKYTREKGYNTIICITDYKEELEKYYLDMLYKRNVDGIIICPFVLDSETYNYEDLLKMSEQKPVVMVNNNTKIGISCFGSNQYKVEYDTVNYLYNLGYRDIIFLYYTIRNTDVNSRNRLNGYIDAMSDLKLTPRYYIPDGDKYPISYFVESVMDKKCDAIMTASDYYVFDLVSEAFKMGMDLNKCAALIGFDDSRFCYMSHPKVSSIKQPIEKIAKRAVDELINKIENKDYNEYVNLEFDCKLILKETGKMAKK